MKAFGRLDATVESLETKWKLWKQEGDRLLARLERRDQRAAAKKADSPVESVSTEQSELMRRIEARRQDHGLFGRIPG